MILKRSSNSMLMAILLKPPPFRRKWSTKFWQFIKIKLIIKNSNGMTAYYKKNLQNLISIVIKEDASDLHLSEDRVPVIRSAGFLVPISNHPALTKQDLKGILEELIDAPKKEIFLEKKQVDFAYDDKGTRFRGNAYLNLGRISIALRLVPKKIRTLEELNLPAVLEKSVNKQQV